MISNSLQDEIGKALLSAGYRRLSDPLIVSGINFGDHLAYEGTFFAYDLVLVIDMSASGSGPGTFVDAVARALDAGDSKRPITVVGVGDDIDEEQIRGLRDVARALLVPTTAKSGDVSAALAVLMPLQVSAAELFGKGSGSSNEYALSLLHGSDLSALANELQGGSGVVQDLMRNLLRKALAS